MTRPHARVCDCPGCSCVGVSRDYMRTMHGDDRARPASGRLHRAAQVVLTWWEDHPWWPTLAGALAAILSMALEP